MRRFALLLLGLLMLASLIHAQTITVKPTMPSVAVGKTVQFTATVTGSTNTAVTWSAGGVVGGNSKAGTISTTGLYTAPTVLPGQNPVLITATSKANSKVSAMTYVNILALGPTITAVSPTQLKVGTITVTITGTGFKSGATVLNSYGSNTLVQLSTVSVTATTIKATGYQGPASTATFRVKNPGSDYSNAITVPVTSSTPTTYTLSVVNGSGSGSYAAGTVVTITANPPPSGQTFLKWTGSTVKDPGAATTTLTMPAANTTVTANYTTTPPTPTTYTLTVVNGTGSGNYAAGTSVTITANPPSSGQVFANWSGATVQNANASTTTLIMPAANTTVTANYTSAPPTPVNYTLTVVNGSGGGSYTAGTVVTITANAPVAGQSFLNWTGAAVQNANAASTTLTMPAANTTVTANYTSPSVQIPYPVSSHPRLWVTVNDLPRLQSWATASNPIYAQGLKPLLNQAVNYYTTQFFPNGVANPNYPDPGDVQGYSVPITEQVGFILAFNSLIDPDPAMRIKYAQYTRNLLMYAMNQAALGHLAGAPFRDPMFAVYNRANGSGEQWPLMVDWIYNATDAGGNPILTSSDKATIRNVFMMWANDCLNAYTTGGDHPSPIGVMNDWSLLPNKQPYRMASNNYYLGHARLLTLMALSIDPSDDPPVNANAPASQVGNSLRSYILNANGAWLYQEFAMMGEPATVASAYGLPGNGAGFGLASGGLPPEGMLYGHSFSYILGQLLALQTAGFNNPSYAGPQIGLINAPVWDRYVTGYISSMTPTAQVPASQTWLGPVYEYASYGDLLRLWVTPDVMQSFTLLALLEAQNGKTTHANAARWMAQYGVEGGANALMSRITQPWSWGTTNSILYFLLFDPAASTPTDPRPGFPTFFYDQPAGRIVAHSDWSPTGTMFDYRASWISINHQVGDAGQFELYRKGEWLTKEMSNYDNNAQGMTTMYHNTLALQNWCANGTPNLQWYEAGEWANGSQWMLGLSAGDPINSVSNGPGYVYATSDLTNLYNRPNYWTPSAGAMDITQATRSILWLNNDYIVVYDRATTQHSGLFKRFNLSLVTNPAISGNTATETLASGQQLFIQTLLPHTPAISAAYAAGNLNPIAQLEPTQYILTVEDPSKPSDTRFLHVLQGADPGVAMAPATYLQSTAGTPFDGAAFGTTAAYFPVNSTGTFTGTTLPVPAGVHTLLVTGLTANSSYTATLQPNGTVTIAAGTGTSADGAGVLRLIF